MSDKPDIRIVVGADIPKTKSVVKDDLKNVVNQINQEQTVANVKLGLDVNATKRLFEDKLNTIISQLKIKPVDLKVKLDTSSITANPILSVNKNHSLPQYNMTQTLAEQKYAHNEFMNQSKERIQIRKEEVKIAELLQKQNRLNTNKTANTRFFDNISNGNIGKELDIYKMKINQLQNSFININPEINSDMDSKLQNLKASYSKILELKQKNGSWDFGSDELAEAVNKYREYGSILKKTIQLNSTQKSIKFANQNDLNNLENFINALQKYRELNDRIDGNIRLKTTLDNLQKQADGYKASRAFDDSDVKKLTASLGDVKTQVRNLNLEGQTFSTKLSSQMQKLGVYFTAAGVMMGTMRQVKQIIQNVIELDKVITDLSVATGYNRERTKELLNTYSDLGQVMGASTKQVAEAADDWLRQGKSIANTNKLIKDSLMLSKLGKIDSSEATTALTTMSKAYKIMDNDMTSLVDKLTAVDAVSATTAGGIAKSFQETAVSAEMAGISIDRMAGYIATVSEVTGDAPESVGTFFRTFLSRMSNIKEGRMIDPDTGEDLSTVETVLKNVGIYLRDDQKQFRNFQIVLDEIAVKWKELSASGDSVGLTKIASALGLTRQQEKAKVLFEHYDEAVKYAEISANSLGTAEEKFNNAYLGSIEARINQFKASYEALSNTLINDNWIKKLVSGGTNFVNLLDSIISKIGSIPMLVTVAAGALSAFNNTGVSIVNMPCYRLRNKSIAA